MDTGKAEDAKRLEAEEVSPDQCDHTAECGCGDWRPRCLQPCASIGVFTAVLSTITIFGNMNYSYYTAVITQIEKCFGLSSSMTGFIKNVDNIGSMLCVLIFSHFCRYSNKPRVFAISTALAALGIFIFAVPHFIYGSGEAPSLDVNSTMGDSSPAGRGRTELCDGVDDSSQKCEEGGNANLRAFNTGAFAIFIVSELVQGVAQSPMFSRSITYMDDNSEQKPPQHLGR
jgi:MFS family permease